MSGWTSSATLILSWAMYSTTLPSSRVDVT